MKVDVFDFDLPTDLIATRPTEPREAARLLEVRGSTLSDYHVGDLPGLLRPGDMLVFNNAKVLPTQLTGHKESDGRKIELTLHKQLSGDSWRAFAKPARKLSPQDRLIFKDGTVAEIAAKEGGEVDLIFPFKDAELFVFLEANGDMPLPPYIRKLREVDAQDRQDYQTVYSEVEGAVASPTAGLHFTDDLLARLEALGLKRAMLTLLAGAGTFLPVKVEDTDDHVMHSEFGVLSDEIAEQINAAKAAGGRVIAIGTTSLRLLESAADENGRLHPFQGDTDIFITPGYRFKIVDLLWTNFHLPKSTLFMLVSAFAGLEAMKNAYDHAKAEGYRFYSYGDASLLWRDGGV